MKSKIENGLLVIELPLIEPPEPTKSGKSLMVASSKGNVTTGLVVDGKRVVVQVNAYIAK